KANESTYAGNYCHHSDRALVIGNGQCLHRWWFHSCVVGGGHRDAAHPDHQWPSRALSRSRAAVRLGLSAVKTGSPFVLFGISTRRLSLARALDPDLKLLFTTPALGQALERVEEMKRRCASRRGFENAVWLLIEIRFAIYGPPKGQRSGH